MVGMQGSLPNHSNTLTPFGSQLTFLNVFLLGKITNCRVSNFSIANNASLYPTLLLS